MVALCPRVVVIDHGRLIYDGDLQALARRVRPDKRLTVRLSRAVERADLEKLGTVVSADAAHAVLSVPPARLQAVVRDALAALPIVDLTIEEAPLEEVMRELFGARTKAAQAKDAQAKGAQIGHPVQGVRVVLDVVMNMYAFQCPLTNLAQSWFNTPSTPSRQDWGQELFLFDTPAYGTYYAAREFLCEMGEFWVSEYHIDGYRIDDFADINNWDFVREFHDRATAKSQSLFPGKPFWVIAEDSRREFLATANKVVDAIWNFGYRDEMRRLLTNSINTSFGQPSRSARVAPATPSD